MPNWCTNRLTVLEKKDDGALQEFLDAITCTADDDAKYYREQHGAEIVNTPEYDLSALYPVPQILKGTSSPPLTVEDIEEKRRRRDAGEFRAHDGFDGETQNGSWVTDAHLQEQMDSIAHSAKAKEETGFSNWYDWSVANWSVKWAPDVHDVTTAIDADGSNVATVQYESAWCPAENLISKISGKFPTLTFVETYMEEGMGFWGANIYDGDEGTPVTYSNSCESDPIIDALVRKLNGTSDEAEEDVYDRMSARCSEILDEAEAKALAVLRHPDPKKQLMTEELFYPEGVFRTRNMTAEDLRFYRKADFPTPEEVFDRYRPVLDAKVPDWEEKAKKINLTKIDEKINKLKNLRDTLAEQMIETQNDGTDVLFCGSDGKTIIKALHFPRSMLNEDGPVILPSANDKVILAAFSDEFVLQNLDEVRNIFQDPSVREQQLEQFLKSLVVKVSHEHAELPEFDWDKVYDLES